MGRYFGVPLVTTRLGPIHFTDLQDKILARIGGWRKRLLSFAGKICLVNYAPYPMLFHVLAHCAVPALTLEWLEKQIRGGTMIRIFGSGIMSGGALFAGIAIMVVRVC